MVHLLSTNSKNILFWKESTPGNKNDHLLDGKPRFFHRRRLVKFGLNSRQLIYGNGYSS